MITIFKRQVYIFKKSRIFTKEQMTTLSLSLIHTHTPVSWFFQIQRINIL